MTGFLYVEVYRRYRYLYIFKRYDIECFVIRSNIFTGASKCVVKSEIYDFLVGVSNTVVASASRKFSKWESKTFKLAVEKEKGRVAKSLDSWI